MFTSFTFICVAIIFALIVYEVLPRAAFFTFTAPFNIISLTVIATSSLLVFGILLTFLIPASYIPSANSDYQNASLLAITSMMLVGATFEELLFRGIVQNLLLLWLGNSWLAIGITTLAFVALHVHYFKKPVMLLNITIPSLVFGWVYFQTNNIVVPIIVHFLLNIGITLLFKYRWLTLKA